MQTSTTSVQMMKDRLKCNAVPIMIPMGSENSYVGEIDLIKMVAITYDKNDIHKLYENEIPAEYADKAAEMHDALVESVAETDEELMMKYLEGEELTVDEIKTSYPRRLLLTTQWFLFSAAQLTETKAFRGFSTQLLTICRLLPMFRPSKVSILRPARKLTAISR